VLYRIFKMPRACSLIASCPYANARINALCCINRDAIIKVIGKKFETLWAIDYYQLLALYCCIVNEPVQ